MKEEIFDVVDIRDRVIGEAFRHEVHGNPCLIHRVVHVLVFNGRGELYLQKRSSAKDLHPGKWDTSVGGHVDRGESYHGAALREMAEELGIRSTRIDFLYKYLHRNALESEYVSTFLCHWDGPIAINPEEIETGRFWSLEQIVPQMETGVFTPHFIDEITRYQAFIKTT